LSLGAAQPARPALPPAHGVWTIGDNVRHQNVASPLVSSGAFGASTATQIITNAMQIITKPPTK